MSDKTILDIFHQGAEEGIPSHWCVQYTDSSSNFAQYEYFNNYDEANKYTMKYGYNPSI